MKKNRFGARLLVAAGAVALAGLACAAPGSATTATEPPAATPTELATAVPTLVTGPCVPPLPDASIPDGASWQIYCDEIHGFAFRYPAGPMGNVAPTDNTTDLYLPFTAGTNISEKYLGVTVLEGASVCESPAAAGYEPGSLPSATVNFNGVDFDKVSGSDAGAGNFRDWTAYSTLQGELCVSMTFTIHSINPGALETPPAVFDPAAESAVYDQVMATFLFFTPSVTGQAEQVPTDVGSVVNSTDCNPPAPSGPDAELVISVYCNTQYHFGFRYAPVGDSGYSGTGPMTLPIKAEGTNLSDKTLEIETSEGVEGCFSSHAAGYDPATLPTENVTFNGVAFTHQSGDDAGAGNRYHWEGYSTTNNGVCVAMTFILHSLNPDNFSTPPAEFDVPSESGMFQTIMNTFIWY